MKYTALFSCFLLLFGCKKQKIDTTPLSHPTNPNLIYFGYTLVDVQFDDPTDKEEKTNYIDEVAPFSNIADLLAVHPTDDLRPQLNIMESYQVKGLIHLNEIFFEIVGETSKKSGTD